MGRTGVVSSVAASPSVRMDGFWDRREFLCGWGAALINICTTFPINKIMFRQMVHGVRAQSAINQLRTEGLHNLYKGLLPPLLSKTASVSLMFGSYSSYRSFLDQQAHHVLPKPIMRLSIAAFLSGSTEAVLCPFERIQMLLQSRDFGNQFQNTFQAFKGLKGGIREHYRGLSAVLLRNGPSNILFFAVKENCQNMLTSSDNFTLSLVEHFVTGALLGAFISTLFYPLNVVRTKMQTVPPGSPFLSIPTACLLVYRERGGSISKIYYGVSMNCTRALLSWGIINVSYEVLRSFLYSKSELETLWAKNKAAGMQSSLSSSSLPL